MKQRIHIVSLDVPFPPDYGAMIDVYYRCKALKEAGYSVILHCFEYGRGRNHAFDEVADACFYYDRPKSPFALFSSLPFIVKTRLNNQLIDKLNEDSDPVLLEGQHCSGIIKRLNKRSIAIRIHNVEWHYYQLLSQKEKSFLKRKFFNWEAKKLKKQEVDLTNHFLFCVTESDRAYYVALTANAVLSPSQFNRVILQQEPMDSYVLYHGNLSVAENQDAVEEILKEYDTSPFHIPLVIAGKNPSNALVQQLKKRKITFYANPTDEQMQKLIQHATVHLLISNQDTGLKLKVLTSLYSGKRCIATAEILHGTLLHQFCTIWDRKTALSKLIQDEKVLSEARQKERNDWLDEHYGPATFLENVERWLNQKSI